MPRPLVLLFTAILSAVVLGSCGGDATSTAPDGGSGEGIEIVAEDIAFGEDLYEATAGTVELRLVNNGHMIHTLVIEGVDGFKLEVTGNGDEDQGRIELGPGTYTIYCDVPGHREAGMEATLDVA